MGFSTGLMMFATVLELILAGISIALGNDPATFLTIAIITSLMGIAMRE